MFVVLIHLPTIKNILTNRIDGRGHWQERRKILHYHPNAKRRVFLSQQLTACDFLSITAANPFAHRKLDKTQHHRHNCPNNDEVPMRIGCSDNIVECAPKHNGESECPHIKRPTFVTNKELINLGQPPLQNKRRKERKHNLRGNTT